MATPAPPNPSVYEHSVESVATAAGINLFLLIACLLAFDLLIYWPKARKILLPNFRSGDVLPGFPLGWARQAWRDRQDPCAFNPDGTVVIRFCQLGFKFSLCGTLMDLVLLPMYYSGSGGADGFNRFSLSNLSDKSNRFWGVVVAAYVLVGVFCHLLLAEWRYFTNLQREHFVHVAQGRCGAELAQAQRSVMVELIPAEARSELAVRQFFERLFGPGSVHSCSLQKDTIPLYLRFDLQNVSRRFFCCCSRRLAKVEQAVVAVADGADGLLRRDVGPETPILPPDDLVNQPRGLSLQDMSAVRELGQGVRQFAAGMIQFGQDLTIGHAGTSTAFVTLNKTVDCAAAQQMVLMHGGGWRASAAPEPRDLIWRNVSKPLSQLQLRILVSQSFLILGILFWTVPVATVQTFANISYLQKQIPTFVSWLEDFPALYAVVTSYLPAMALIGLMAVLPIAFEFVSRRYEGHKTKSEVERRLLNRCFAYQLASLYVTVLASSLIESLKEILDHPSNVLSILSNSLPQVAVYFITFVLARVGTSLPMMLLRPAAACGGSEAVQVCAFGSELANSALVLVIGLTYSFIAPAILPACALYFGLASLMYRWLFAHVYTSEFDSAGMMWHDLFRCVIVGLFMGTLSLVAIAAIKASHLQATLLLPLPVWVLVFGGYCGSKLGAPSRQVALADAVSVDHAVDATQFSDSLYIDPILTAFYSISTAQTQVNAPSAVAEQ